ncbi:MAG: hypothetical protein RL251_106 [Pseudomonadota bacterium]
MRSILPHGQTAALGIAMAGAALAAVTTMLVPVSLLEGVAESSGLSELIPAAGAPLGDTARAFIAFATGAMTLAVLSYLLLRAHMPWNKGADDIRELGDVPPHELFEEHLVAPLVPLEAEQRVEATLEAAGSQPSIAEMVAQLEAAVAFRRQKLAELEAVAADLSAAADGDEPSPAVSELVAPAVTENDAAVAAFRPALDAVPTEAVQDDDIDSALAAALAALHRIHGGAR